MKKLLSFQKDYILKKVLNSNELRQKFDNCIVNNAYSYIEEKLRCFNAGCIDYEVGFCCYNYLKVKNAIEFVIGVRKSINYFGGTERLEKQCSLCEKLKNSNLFNYHIKKLCDMYYEEELKAEIDYASELSYAIYNKDEKNKELQFQLESFEWELDKIYVDSQDKLCYMKYCQ